MQPGLKKLAEGLLLYAGPAHVSRWLHRGRSLVLAYHNIVPEGERVLGDASLHLHQADFARHLDILLEGSAEVVSLDELMDAALRPNRGDPTRRIAITFDDGYRGAIHAGVEELVGRGLPATFFVVPGLVNGHTFWWDALSVPGSLNTDVREAALLEARGRTDEVIAWARRQGLVVGAVPEHAQSASETELRAVASLEGIEMASHTWSHPNLTVLDTKERRNELEMAALWVQQTFDVEPGWLSYPYGIHNAEVAQAAAEMDHRGAFRVDGGWLPHPLEPSNNIFRLPRLNIPAGLSLSGFSLRLAGAYKPF